MSKEYLLKFQRKIRAAPAGSLIVYSRYLHVIGLDLGPIYLLVGAIIQSIDTEFFISIEAEEADLQSPNALSLAKAVFRANSPQNPCGRGFSFRSMVLRPG